MTLDLTQSLPSHVRATSGRPVEDSTLMEVWQGLSAAIVDQIADNWAATTERYAKGRQEHYFSAEFLMGRALLNNLSNLGLVEKAREALAAYGLDLGQVLEEEPDAALGNGGLGRLAACFLDSCATLDLPVRGHGILHPPRLAQGRSPTEQEMRGHDRGRDRQQVPSPLGRRPRHHQANDNARSRGDSALVAAEHRLEHENRANEEEG